METRMCKQLMILLVGLILGLTACQKDEGNEPDPPSPPDEETSRATGWNQSSEDLDKYPRQISSNFLSSGSSKSLPSKVDLSNKLPPVGDQGQYGTCVAWSVGYALRGYMYAVEKGLSQQDLKQTRNQFSPKDLWVSIPSDGKSQGCGGAAFDPALSAMVSRGIATMETVPYSSLNCDGSPQSSWTKEAGNYKIKNYRMVGESDLTVQNMKTLLSQGQSISFGARLGDNFMSWQGGGILSNDSYISPNAQHAYHAMLLVGYDDSKGANGAFLIFNSWGTSWGDKGYIWIDYNFFINNFMYIAFVATPESNVNPNDDNEIDPNDLNTGDDLAAYDAFDMSYSDLYGSNRCVYFNVYNVGSKTIPASKKWSVVYMYYNAYNANDCGILSHYYYTNEVNGVVTFPQAGLSLPPGGVGYCINNNIPAGKNIAAVLFNQPNYEYFIQPYYLPRTLNGFYYLVLIADAFDAIQEVDEQNNFFFISDPMGYPIPFVNGTPISYTKSENGELRSTEEEPQHSVINENNANAYSPEEIQDMLIKLRESGQLEEMTKAFDAGKTEMPQPMGK